jgi:hypothetical protein
VKNRTIFGLLFFLTLIASTVFGSLAENPRQGFNGIFTGLHQGGTLSKAATTPGVSACFLESSRQVFLLGQGGKGLSFNPKQIGKKFGEHRDVTRPGYRTHQEYLDKAKQMMNDPNAKVNKFPSASPKYPGETHIQSGNDLLRLDPNGNFRSLYPLE